MTTIAAKLLNSLDMTDSFELVRLAKAADPQNTAGKVQQMLAMTAANAIMRLEYAEKDAQGALNRVNDAVTQQNMNLALGRGPNADDLTHRAAKYAEAAAKVATLVAQFEGAALPLKAILGIEI